MKIEGRNAVAEAIAGVIPRKMARNRWRGILRFGPVKALKLMGRLRRERATPVRYYLAVCAGSSNHKGGGRNRAYRPGIRGSIPAPGSNGRGKCFKQRGFGDHDGRNTGSKLPWGLAYCGWGGRADDIRNYGG